MAIKLTNNAVSLLAGNISAVSTTINLAPGDGVKFPVLGVGDWHPLTLINATGVREIVRCTARTADALTIVRARESTAAMAFLAGDRVELRVTAAAFEAFVLTWSTLEGKPTFSTVAQTGAYADLSGRPTIPTVSTAGASGVYADLTGKPTLGTAAALSEASLRQLPFTAQRTSAYVAVLADAGQTIPITAGGITINNSVFAAGDTFSIYNESDSTQPLTQGSGLTLRKVGSILTGSMVIPERGIATIVMRSPSDALVIGVA